MCNDSIYQEARGFFLQQGRSDLLHREMSSLVGAYLITKYIRSLGKTGFSFIEGVFSYEELFFSTAHSEDLLVVAVDTKKVAVDVEYVNKRDESLLQNVHIPNSLFAQRENFYLQWCAQECLVKFLGLNSTEMQEMTIIDVISNQHFSINERIFDLLVLLHYRGREYPIHAVIKDGKVMTFLHQNDNIMNN